MVFGVFSACPILHAVDTKSVAASGNIEDHFFVDAMLFANFAVQIYSTMTRLIYDKQGDDVDNFLHIHLPWFSILHDEDGFVKSSSVATVEIIPLSGSIYIRHSDTVMDDEYLYVHGMMGNTARLLHSPRSKLHRHVFDQPQLQGICIPLKTGSQ